MVSFVRTVAAIVRQRIHRLDEIAINEEPYWTALEHVRSLGNYGTLMRTSAAVGATGFILIGDEIDPFDPAVVRATMGALFKQKIVRTNASELLCWARRQKIEVIGASPNGSQDYRHITYKPPIVLMLGGERKGLTDEQRAICARLVRIPMAEGMDSLNVAVAGSLLMYEVFR